MSHATTRRSFLSLLGATTVVGCSGLGNLAGRGRLKQSVAAWCFMNQGPKWSAAELVHHAKTLGCDAIELIEPQHWDLLKANGLVCAATKSHTFVRGMNHKGHWAECHAKLRTAIENNARAGYPNVMTFTGLLDTSKETNGAKVTPEQGMANCIAGYKQIVGLAEQHGVTLILEPLNTRDARPMKGHPGYLGDHVDECVEIIKGVGSPNLRLLFDVYHVQIMDGDLVRRIGELGDLIAHVQMAGCPGRGPLDGSQEIHYPAVMRALVASGYQGYVGHEWIATGDAAQQLRDSVATVAV